MTTINYICDLCNKNFNQKKDLTKHKKISCISIDNIDELSKQENKSSITTIFKYCLDVLRDNEHITGDKALRNLAFLLDLRLLEKQFNDKIINIDNYEYDFSSYECSNDEFNEEHKKKLLGFTRFSNLVKENENNLYTIMKYLWEDILSVHPTTKNIFFKDKCFEIQNQSTYKKLIDKLYSFKFEDIEADILGEAYEQVISDVMTGKVLGQYFTPPKVKQMMVNLLNPQLKDNGTIETIFDPAMGTGGFLITSIRHIIKQSKLKKIDIDWNFIRQHGLGGREAETDTYQLAISNMLISTGHMFDVLEKGDTIRSPIIKKYDIVLANPPFGIDGLNYLEIKHELKNEYLPIKSNSAVPLFIQAIIYMLKINGRCAIVLPDGKELFSKNNELIAIREFLMKTCELKEIIYLPSGIFTYTSIKTCVFYFIKKKDGLEILETKVKYSKIGNKEIERKNIFSKIHQTSKVKFYDYNLHEDIKNLLVEVDIEQIAENKYSLNYAEYLEDEKKQYDNDQIIIKKLGDICNIIKGDKKKSKDGKNNGLYPLYYCSILGHLYLDTYDYDNEGLIINKTNGSGKAMIYYHNGKYNIGETVIHFKSKNKEILTKYIYYYLYNNINELEKYYRGCNQKSIVEKDLFSIKIPIPSLEKQEEIVKYLDFIYEECIKTSNEKINQLKKLNEYCLNNQKNYGKNTIKKLKDICEFIKTGKNKPKDNKTGTLYPYYGTGEITGYTDEYLFDGEYILTARNGTIGNCFLSSGKIFPSDHIFVIDIKNKFLMKYIYYILSNNEKLDKLKTGVGIPNITKGTLENFKIQIPSDEIIKNIISYFENNNNLIKQLEEEINHNKIIAKEFIANIMKNSKHDNIESENNYENNSKDN